MTRTALSSVEDRPRQLGCAKITSVVLKDEAGTVPFWEGGGYVRDYAIDRYAKNLV